MIAWFDSVLLNWFQSIHNDILTGIFEVITTLGEAGIIWILIGLLLLVGTRTRWLGITVLIALLFTLLVGNLTLKPLVARPRPCWRHPEIPLLIANPKDFSFPSGHSMSSFAAASAIWMWNRRAGVVALAGAVIMAATRLYFYVHYPTDVVAGMLIGVVLGVLAHGIVSRVRRRWEEKRTC